MRWLLIKEKNQLCWMLKVKWQCSLLSCVQLFATLWTVACQHSLSVGFPSQEYEVGSHSLLQGIFPTQGWNPGLLHCRQILYYLTLCIPSSVQTCTVYKNFMKMNYIKTSSHLYTSSCFLSFEKINFYPKYAFLKNSTLEAFPNLTL